jgi:hypothetical protein
MMHYAPRAVISIVTVFIVTVTFTNGGFAWHVRPRNGSGCLGIIRLSARSRHQRRFSRLFIKGLSKIHAQLNIAWASIVYRLRIANHNQAPPSTSYASLH